MQLDLFGNTTPDPIAQTRLLKEGDRIAVPTWGGQKATVVQVSPLIVMFDGRDYETRLSARNAKGVELVES